MAAFRILLALIFIGITAYTAITVSNHGINLVAVFFGDLATMGWPGQFNFDFLCFLVLSGLWVAWRNNFTPLAFVLGAIATFGGALFLSLYLIIESYRVKGDIYALLLGQSRLDSLTRKNAA